MTCGIYTITNKHNNNIYVGVSVSIEYRWETHKRALINGYENQNKDGFDSNKKKARHHQINLQNEFNDLWEEYGENIWGDVYDFGVAMEVGENFFYDEAMNLIEDAYILKLREDSDGYKQMTNVELKEKYNWSYTRDKSPNIILEKNKDSIIYDYFEKRMTYKTIAEKYNTNTCVVMKFFRRHDIKARNHSESKLFFNIEEYKFDIIHMYTEEKISASAIGKKYGIGCGTVTSYLKKWGIKTRNLAELVSGFCLDDYKEEVIDMIFNKKMSKKEVALHFNLHPITIRRRLVMWGYLKK